MSTISWSLQIARKLIVRTFYGLWFLFLEHKEQEEVHEAEIKPIKER